MFYTCRTNVDIYVELYRCMIYMNIPLYMQESANAPAGHDAGRHRPERRGVEQVLHAIAESVIVPVQNRKGSSSTRAVNEKIQNMHQSYSEPLRIDNEKLSRG